MLENPHEKDTHQETLDRLAEQYRKYPTAIASAEPAEPDGYTQFGFVEYPVAFPVTIAKVAKKAKKPKKNRA
jgi:hypothetical protein